MREKELRLALVCYGGVSLAIYMHGITKEVWKLLRASTARARCQSASAAAAAVAPDIAKLLVSDDGTATQVNLRLAPGSLDERAILVGELRADLDARIAALDLPADSILLADLPAGQAAVRATPAGLATVGIGLLENLSANRANLTYLALALSALYLVARLRSLSRAVLARHDQIDAA